MVLTLQWAGRPPTLAVCVGALAMGVEACGGSSASPLPAVPSAEVGIALPWTAASCAAQVTDIDLDGLEDDCEFALARAFAPELRVSPQACNVEDGRIQGGYAFGVFPSDDPERLLIGYAPAYVRDCGWEGPKCWLRLWGGCTGHGADSEFIGVAVDFNRSASRWSASAVFLSAHCFGASDADCRWYAGDELWAFEWLDGVGGAVRVWVAEGKNANYPSRGRCDRGHWWYDTCDRNRLSYVFPVERRSQNVGNPLGAVGTQPGGARSCFALADLGWQSVGGGADFTAIECFGGTEAFRGWLPAGVDSETPTGATSYRRYFQLLLEGPTT